MLGVSNHLLSVANWVDRTLYATSLQIINSNSNGYCHIIDKDLPYKGDAEIRKRIFYLVKRGYALMVTKGRLAFVNGHLIIM